MAAENPVITWPKGLTPRPFQVDACRFSLARNNTYLALEQGLGKTIAAALIHNTLRALTVYVCPPYMVANMQEEFAKWLLPEAGRDHIVVGKTAMPLKLKSVWIVADNQLTHPSFQKSFERLVRGVEKARRLGRDVTFQLMVDEAQRFNQPRTQRTKALLDMAPYFDRAVLLSGTPMPNRPIELYTLVSHFAPDAIGHMSFFKYARKFCGAHKGPFGWDFSGSSNLPELSSRLRRSFMLRLYKADVLKDLPPKTEELLLIDRKMPPFVTAMEGKLLAAISRDEKREARTIVQQLRALGNEIDGLHVATYRKAIGMIKAPLAAKYISACLDESPEALLVFAIHKDVVSVLAHDLAKYAPLIITGSTKTSERQGIVKEFQTNPARRLILANVQAGGVGHTMTKAKRVFFVEYSWNPADNDQAADRAHRIGQRDFVYVQYAVLRNSLDRRIITALLDKRASTIL